MVRVRHRILFNYVITLIIQYRRKTAPDTVTLCAPSVQRPWCCTNPEAQAHLLLTQTTLLCEPSATHCQLFSQLSPKPTLLMHCPSCVEKWCCGMQSHLPSRHWAKLPSRIKHCPLSSHGPRQFESDRHLVVSVLAEKPSLHVQVPSIPSTMKHLEDCKLLQSDSTKHSPVVVAMQFLLSSEAICPLKHVQIPEVQTVRGEIQFLSTEHWSPNSASCACVSYIITKKRETENNKAWDADAILKIVTLSWKLL